MKSLELNPQRFDVELCCLDTTKETEEDYGTMTVGFRFGETTGDQVFLGPELEKVGRWFLAAAKRVKKLKAK